MSTFARSAGSLDSLAGVSNQLLIVDYVSAALLAILVYEVFDLLPCEVHFIWLQKWKLVNIIYLFCRYIPMLMITLALITFHGPMETCSSGFYGVVALSFASLIISELCFIIRAYAVWGSSRPTAIFLSVLTAGMICALTLDLSQLRTTETLDLNSPLSLCGIAGPASCAMWGLIIVLLVDTIVIVMMIWARTKRYRAAEVNPLLVRIYWDSVMYFVLNSFTTAAAIVLYMKTPGLAIMSSRLASALTSIIASRMIIGLKEYGDQGPMLPSQDRDNRQSAMISTIQFRPQDVPKV